MAKSGIKMSPGISINDNSHPQTSLTPANECRIEKPCRLFSRILGFSYGNDYFERRQYIYKHGLCLGEYTNSS